MERKRVTRRQALRFMLGAAGAAASGSLLACSQQAAPAAAPTQAAAQPGAAAQPVQGITSVPAVRKKVNLKYWAWSDTPAHQKMHTDSIALFEKSQNFITVEMDVTGSVNDVRQKVISAFAAGSAPDVAMCVNYYNQEYYDNGILEPVDQYFNKWDQKDDFFPEIIELVRAKPGSASRPVLYLPYGNLCFVLYYRADWFEEAKLEPPKTYDEFIEAAKKIARPPDRYGYGVRGKDYYGVQPIETQWRSAGLQLADLSTGRVDLDAPEAVAVTEKWVGMLTKDKSAQPSAVNDRYAELFALMEANKLGMFIYGIHAQNQFVKALGDRIQVVTVPRVKNNVMMAVPEGDMILSSSKEKDAAWELVSFLSSGEPAKIFTRDRGNAPVRKSIAADPVYQNRFFKLAEDSKSIWWTPPYGHKHWANYQDKIAPYWQQALQQQISVNDFQMQAAKLMRGEA